MIAYEYGMAVVTAGCLPQQRDLLRSFWTQKFRLTAVTAVTALLPGSCLLQLIWNNIVEISMRKLSDILEGGWQNRNENIEQISVFL